MSAIDDELKPIDPPKAATKRNKAHWPDLIVGGSAIVIAVISLAVALRQSQIMERQLAASVWPYLQYHTSNATDDGQRVISFGVENVRLLRRRWRLIHSAEITRTIMTRQVDANSVRPDLSSLLVEVTCLAMSALNPLVLPSQTQPSQGNSG